MLRSRIIWRKRFLTILLFTVFIALNARMVEMKQKLTDKQIASFLKHDGFLSANIYDKFYKMVREKVKDLQKMRKTSPISSCSLMARRNYMLTKKSGPRVSFQ